MAQDKETGASAAVPQFVIRRTQPGDAEAMVRIFTGPRVIWGTMQLPFPSTEVWRKRLEPSEHIYSLVACVDGEVVGTLAVHTIPNPRRRHVGQIGIAVRDDWQGRGAGTALMQAGVDLADRWLNLTRLELEVYTDNEPAIRLYKKFGFAVEGTFARHAFRDGRFVDSHAMARLWEPA